MISQNFSEENATFLQDEIAISRAQHIDLRTCGNGLTSEVFAIGSFNVSIRLNSQEFIR